MNSPMKASWLLETDVFHENLKEMVKEIKQQGMRVEIASYLATTSDKTYLNLFDENDCVIYYGSLNFANQVKREAKWIPGVYYNKKAFNCSSYYPELAQVVPVINAWKYVMLPYADLLRQEKFLFETLGEDGCVFVRPDSGAKPFTGQLVKREEWKRDVNYMSFYGTQPADICVVSAPRNIEAEWRFVVIEGRVITGSQYKLDDKVNVECDYPPEALELADKAAANYSPDPVWCVDVCRTRLGNYYLLEIGCFSCAGLYACNLPTVVREVSAAALREWKDINGTD
jgi:hypothetical protein